MSPGNKDAIAAPRHGLTRRRRAVIAVSGLAVTAAGVLTAGLVVNGPAHAAVQVNCQAAPISCGFPGAANTGVHAGATLKKVPGQVSKGPGWTYTASTHTVHVAGNGAVLSHLSINGTISVTASHVTINHVKVVSNAGAYGISLRHTNAVTIENSTIKGLNATTGRVNSAIGDAYGDSTKMVVKNNNISWFRCAVQLRGGLVEGNYIHSTGYISGDHTNGVIANGGPRSLVITHNTILINRSQTDAITLDTMTVNGPVTNKLIAYNLLAGGAYVIYGGTGYDHTTSGVRIENNRFGQGFYPKSGQFGPVAYVSPSRVHGNTWTGNVWDSTGATVKAP